MKIVWRVIGISFQDISWPEGWPLPRENETIDTDESIWVVSRVVYFPNGEDEETEPFVYITLDSQ